jgi:hypothetical protein
MPKQKLDLFQISAVLAAEVVGAEGLDPNLLRRLLDDRPNRPIAKPIIASAYRVGSSIFLGGCKVQWHTLSGWFANVEIKVRLFVAFGVLLPPQHQQKRRKHRKDNLRPVDLRVTSRTESDHQMQHRLARFPMMHSRMGITAHPASVSIAL